MQRCDPILDAISNNRVIDYAKDSIDHRLHIGFLSVQHRPRDIDSAVAVIGKPQRAVRFYGLDMRFNGSHSKIFGCITFQH